MTSIYGNKTAYTLIELSSFAFVIWILLMTIYLTIRKFQTKNKGLVLEEYKVEPIIHKAKRIVPVEAPIEAYSNTIISKDQLKDTKTNQDPMLRIYDSMLTVEDYKLLLELLKEHRHKEEIKKEELRLKKEKRVINNDIAFYNYELSKSNKNAKVNPHEKGNSYSKR